MSKIIAFAGSNSSVSINHKWLTYIKEHHVTEMELINLSDLNIPMYDMDTEKESGIPADIQSLYNKIQQADVVLLSTSEHNGSYTSYFKTTVDWLSRYNREFVKDKKVLITGTSPGRGGASSSIANSTALLERFGAHVKATFALPSWDHTFENGKLVEEKTIELQNFLSNLK